MYHFLRSKKGFTIMELFTCIIVLGILCAVAVPIYSGVTKKHKVNECRMNCQMMETVIGEVVSGMVDNGKKQNYHVNVNHASGTGSQYLNNYVKNWVFVTDNCQKGAPASFAEKGVPIVPACDNGKSVWAVARDEDYTRAQGHLYQFANYPKPHCNLTDSGRDLYAIYGSRIYNGNDVFMYAIYKHVDEAGNVSDDECVTIGDLRGGYRKDANSDYNDGCKDGSYLKKKALAEVKLYKYFANEEVPICPFDTEGKYSYFILIDGAVVCNCPECLAAKHDLDIVEAPKIGDCK